SRRPFRPAPPRGGTILTVVTVMMLDAGRLHVRGAKPPPGQSSWRWIISPPGGRSRSPSSSVTGALARVAGSHQASGSPTGRAPSGPALGGPLAVVVVDVLAMWGSGRGWHLYCLDNRRRPIAEATAKPKARSVATPPRTRAA